VPWRLWVDWLGHPEFAMIEPSRSSPASRSTSGASAASHAAAAATGMSPAAGQGAGSLMARIAAALVLLILSIHCAAEARRLWVKERNNGMAAGRIANRVFDKETSTLLDTSLAASPRDGLALYLKGMAILQVEMLRDHQGGTVSLEALDASAAYFQKAISTILFPAKVYFFLGLAHQYGALLCAREKNMARLPDFAGRSVDYLFQARRLEPAKSEDQANFWVDVSRNAEMAGRPHQTLAAVELALSHPKYRPAPELAPVWMARRQNAAFILGNAPESAMTLYRRWLDNPKEGQLWAAMGILSRMPEAREASLLFVENLAAQHPGDENVQNLLNVVRREVRGGPRKPGAAPSSSAKPVSPPPRPALPPKSISPPKSVAPAPSPSVSPVPSAAAPPPASPASTPAPSPLPTAPPEAPLPESPNRPDAP